MRPPQHGHTVPQTPQTVDRRAEDALVHFPRPVNSDNIVVRRDFVIVWDGDFRAVELVKQRFLEFVCFERRKGVPGAHHPGAKREIKLEQGGLRENGEHFGCVPARTEDDEDVCWMLWARRWAEGLRSGLRFGGS